MVKDNIKLGELSIPLPSLGSFADKEIELRYTYDVDGLLEVEVTLTKSGEKHALVIENNPGLLTELEIEARLIQFKKLKIHPRDRIVNRTLFAEAERLYTRLQGDSRDTFGQEISLFEIVLEGQNENAIRKAVNHLRNVIHAIQSNSYIDS